jgi:hypothetical protein
LFIVRKTTNNILFLQILLEKTISLLELLTFGAIMPQIKSSGSQHQKTHPNIYSALKVPLQIFLFLITQRSGACYNPNLQV